LVFPGRQKKWKPTRFFPVAILDWVVKNLLFSFYYYLELSPHLFKCVLISLICLYEVVVSCFTLISSSPHLVWHNPPLEFFVTLVVSSPHLVWHDPLWLLGGRGNSMVREVSVFPQHVVKEVPSMKKYLRITPSPTEKDIP